MKRPPSTPVPVADRRRAWLRLGALGAGLAAAVAIVALTSGFSAQGVRDWVEGFGVVAPLGLGST